MENIWNILTIIVFPLFGAGFWLCWNRIGEHIIANALEHKDLLVSQASSITELRAEILRSLERIEKKLDKLEGMSHAG